VPGSTLSTSYTSQNLRTTTFIGLATGPPLRLSGEGQHKQPTAIAAAISTALLLGGASVVQASSHGEAPHIKSMPKVDGTDFYVFNSYEPGREDYISLIANYQGEESVPVPLRHVGPLGLGDNQGAINVNETYFVGVTLGSRRAQNPVWAVRPDSGLRLFTKPYDNAGTKTFPSGYDNFVRSTTNSGEVYYNVRFDQCPEGAQDGRVFAGQRKDSFFYTSVATLCTAGQRSGYRTTGQKPLQCQ